MVKHPNVLRFERDPFTRRLNQYWREKYGTIILRARETQARTERELRPDVRRPTAEDAE